MKSDNIPQSGGKHRCPNPAKPGTVAGHNRNANLYDHAGTPTDGPTGSMAEKGFNGGKIGGGGGGSTEDYSY